MARKIRMFDQWRGIYIKVDPSKIREPPKLRLLNWPRRRK